MYPISQRRAVSFSVDADDFSATSVLLKKRASCTKNGSARIRWPAALATLLFADVLKGHGDTRSFVIERIQSTIFESSLNISDIQELN